MSGLTVDDFKNVLLELYLAQRQNAVLCAQIASLTQPGGSCAPEEGEIDDGGGRPQH